MPVRRMEDQPVTKPQRRSAPPPASMAILPARAAEALQQNRFKEAVELYKQLVRQDPRPDWKQCLAEAYRGRASGLAAKGMFKEAAMVFENALVQGGKLPDPSLYVACLIREGQQPKAAAYLLDCVANGAVPPDKQSAVEELTAALLLAIPQLPTPTCPDPPEAARWRALAAASRDAVAAWVNGAAADEVDRRLKLISLRSAFRPIRLLLQCLMATPANPERTRRLLETITPDSAFFPWRQAVEAAIQAGPGIDANAWSHLTPPQQAFVAETGGLPAEAVQSLSRLSAEVRGSPGALFAWLLKQTDLPQADVRSACLNLLPRVPDRVAQFENRFGKLPELERYRVQALAAEARGDWQSVERFWSLAAELCSAAEDRRSHLSAGVIYRHLAHLATVHPELEGGDYRGSPKLYYLERSGAADPDHVPTVLQRIATYRQDSRDKEWHRLADAAAQRFPDDAQVLLQATESAVARRAYKKAAGFARRLLAIDPINPGVRRQMIELQVAHARKQARAKRPDLAARELAQAAEWDRADAPSGLLRIARGLVALQGGDKEQGAAWLRDGAALAGGGVAGWFRAVLEAELMKTAAGDASWLHKELANARQSPPTREQVMAVVSALSQSDAGEAKRAASGLLLSMRAWLRQGAAIDWSMAEFQVLADVFGRFDAFDVLGDYARAARGREPANPEWRFQAIVARARGNPDAMTMAETAELEAMLEAAAERQDVKAARRIAQFLDLNLPRWPVGPGADDLPDALDDAQLLEILQMVATDMPKGAADNLRGLVREVGQQAAVQQTIDSLRASELGAVLPEPMIRQLCEDMVAKAMGRPARGRDRLHA